MKTTLFAVLVAIMASSNAISISDQSAEGEQDGTVTSYTTVTGGRLVPKQEPDINSASSDSGASINGHATSDGVSTNAS